MVPGTEKWVSRDGSKCTKITMAAGLSLPSFVVPLVSSDSRGLHATHPRSAAVRAGLVVPPASAGFVVQAADMTARDRSVI